MALSSRQRPVALHYERIVAPLARGLLLLALSVAIAAGPAAAAPPGEAGGRATVFMNHMWNRAIELLNSKTPFAVRQARFRDLFHNDFDSPGIARFVLGRYWRSATPEEQKEFLKLFEDYVVFVYTARLSDFGAEEFKIKGSRTDQDAVIVSTDVITPGAPMPLTIDWRLVSDDGAYKISDVIVEGVSMMVTQRSEFASVIQRHGGQVQELLNLMRQKTASAEHQPAEH
jgi:phospholipid transport system substrate-binding protein